MTKTKKPLRGKALVAATMNQILKHPETWVQHKTHCGSSHCFGGWMQVLTGTEQRFFGVVSDMERLGGMDARQARMFFDRFNSLRLLYALSKAFIAGKPLDQVTEFKGRMVPLKVGKGKG